MPEIVAVIKWHDINFLKTGDNRLVKADYQLVMHETDILTAAGAARILNKHPRTVRRLQERGVLFGLRADNGMRLFLRSEVERVAREHYGRA